ncbi:uncharacterized protein N7469_002986 [Penicillium citrinum]|uniref:Uncharacterized protein n=2 Tax=Penicillium TaxID=5073 RepID=A0A9W9PBM4_PENCI|nr:uncharacterized protein N7469_002986 [Penicillium citrinum]KAJ5241395.1 hypothetical protein N7469_002986 [Penicillium citrinum]KAK5789236.1 hypothetical protein VI817_008360 [Penicillium citrinum]
MSLDKEPDITAIAAGTLDDDKSQSSIPTPSAHIFLSEKASWFQVPDDGAERWVGWPQGTKY